MIQSSTSSPLENDKLTQLIERLDRMQNKMDAMLSRDFENEQLTEQLDRMQNKIDELNDKWTKKLGVLEVENEQLKNKNLQQDEELQLLKSQILYPNFSLLASKRDNGQSSKVLTNPPTSCQELKNQNGLWPMDGIHLLKKNNTIQAAFCLFAADGSPVSETSIGQLSVKSKIVHFYVQRNAGFGTPNAIMPFDMARLNEGGAFNLPLGVFTVPVPGIYHFDFSALKLTNAGYVHILLQINGVDVGRAHTNHGGGGTYESLSMSASLRLATGDRVNLYNEGAGALHDDGRHFTHFIGWLVEEDLI